MGQAGFPTTIISAILEEVMQQAGILIRHIQIGEMASAGKGDCFG